jgi:aminoglycoside phosphotransferase (APT) family kinase protein
VEIDTTLVLRLLEEQHPDLAHLPVRPFESGWDNAMYRLGEDFSIRLPRRQAAATLIENEQKWLPVLADRLPLPIPAPVRTGKPGAEYPWCWSVLPWLKGKPADQEEPHTDQAGVLAAFLRSLHTPAPDAAPLNPVRGVSLSLRAKAVEERMQRIETKTNLITPKIRRVWQTALQAPIDVPATWLHGDMHARNVLVERGTITGIIDWGDITSGDRATDLAVFWMLFDDPQARWQAMEAYGGLSTPTLQRARGWAILFGVMLLDTGLVDHPRHAVMGERTLARVSQEE